MPYLHFGQSSKILILVPVDWSSSVSRSVCKNITKGPPGWKNKRPFAKEQLVSNSRSPRSAAAFSSAFFYFFFRWPIIWLLLSFWRTAQQWRALKNNNNNNNNKKRGRGGGGCVMGGWGRWRWVERYHGWLDNGNMQTLSPSSLVESFIVPVLHEAECLHVFKKRSLRPCRLIRHTR